MYEYEIARWVRIGTDADGSPLCVRMTPTEETLWKVAKQEERKREERAAHDKENAKVPPSIDLPDDRRGLWKFLRASTRIAEKAFCEEAKIKQYELKDWRSGKKYQDKSRVDIAVRETARRLLSPQTSPQNSP